MNRRTTLGIALACLAYLATLIATLPASWMSQAIESLSRQSLQLRDVRGSAWTGNGQLYLRQRSGDLLDLGPMSWSSSRSSLLRGKFVTDAILGKSNGAVRVELSPASVTLRGVKLAFPGEVMAQVVPAIGPLGPQGALMLRSENLRLADNEVLGLAEVEWRPARLSAASGLDLGSHVARLRAGGRKIDFELGSIEGPLRLSGSGTWTLQTGLLASGTLELTESRPPIATFLQNVCSDYRSQRCTFGAGR